MTEIIIGCSYTYGVALEDDCDEEPRWKLIFQDDNGETLNLISCDHHLADLCRGNEEIYGMVGHITLEELP